MKYFVLDQEEQELSDAFDRGEFKSVKNVKGEIKKLQMAARATLRKNKNMNIRVTLKTWLKLKAKAIEQGLPYQTLASSILHKYANS